MSVLRMPQRVLVVEDQEAARRNVIETLTGAGFRIAAETATAAVARALAPRLAFDIALLDVYLPDGDGIDLAAELRAAGCGARIVMFTCSHKPNDLLRALRAGADGYVTKDAEPSRLLREVAAVAHGETPISPNMLGALVREFQRLNVVRHRRATVVRERLTPREWQILNLLADGKSTAGIALELYISIETVRSHVKAIMRKLGVHSRVAAIARLEELRDSDELEAAA